MTAPHDIHHPDNGRIDFDFYHAQAAALRARAKRDTSRPRAFLGLLLITAIMLGFSAISASAPERRISVLQQEAQALRIRIERLSAADSHKWWQRYGKSTTRSKQAAITELQRQLTETEAALAVSGSAPTGRVSARASTGTASRGE